MWQGKALSEPAALILALLPYRDGIKLVGIEACPLSEWLYGALAESGFPIVCFETRHTQRFLSSRPNKLHGIGAEFATVLTREVFYRPFQNRRQVASYVGLTPAPYDSGDTKHDQGINKAGNARARVIAVQMAWLWLRYQSADQCQLASEAEVTKLTKTS